MSVIKTTLGFEPVNAEIDLVEFIKLIEDVTSIKLDKTLRMQSRQQLLTSMRLMK